MFSVLLSIYCKEQVNNLSQCLDSILSQTLLPAEIILVKDGALTKELDDIIELYCQKCHFLKPLSLPTNSGLGIALNEGLKHCSYDLVARMDTDDIAKSDRFDKQIEIFKNNPDIDIISSWIDEFKGDISNIISTRKLPETHNDIYRYAKSRNPINHPVAMFKKQSVLNSGGYKHFPLFEDYYLWIRMLINGCQFYNIQESLLFYRTSSDMFKRRGGLKYAHNEYLFQKQLRSLNFISTPEFVKNVSTRLITRIVPNSIREIIYKKILR